MLRDLQGAVAGETLDVDEHSDHWRSVLAHRTGGASSADCAAQGAQRAKSYEQVRCTQPPEHRYQLLTLLLFLVVFILFRYLLAISVFIFIVFCLIIRLLMPFPFYLFFDLNLLMK